MQATDDDRSDAFAADLAAAELLAEDHRAAATRRAYTADLQALQGYLRARGKPVALPVPPAYVAAFVAHEALGDLAAGLAPKAIATIERRLRGISAMHRDDGHDDPTKHPSVRNALRGARKRLRGQPVGRKSALKLEDLEQMLKRIPNTNAGRRDRALLLLGLAGALRRSELVALHAEDITRTGEGILVKVRASKTDQTGKGFTIPIARGDNDTLCAVKALQDWRAASGNREGPLFVQVRKGDHITDGQLSDKAVALILKARAEAVGLDPELLAGHSLRAGGITQARRNGHDEGEIAKLSGHKNIAILRTYLRPDDDFEGTAQVLRSDRRERESH